MDSRVEGDEVGCTTRGEASGDDLKRPRVHGRVRRRIGGGEESGEGEALTQLYPQPGAWLKPRPA